MLLDRGMSVEELASALGMNNSTMVYNWIENKYYPSQPYLFKLADFFCCSMDYLLGRTDDFTYAKTKSTLEFKTQLTKFLELNSISKYKLAKELQINKGNVYAWFNKGCYPTTEMIVKIADYLHCSVDELIGRNI